MLLESILISEKEFTMVGNVYYVNVGSMDHLWANKKGPIILFGLSEYYLVVDMKHLYANHLSPTHAMDKQLKIK